MRTHRLSLAVASLAAVAAFAAPTAAQAAPCVVHLPGPGDTWDLGADGTLDNQLNVAGGSNFDAGHGALKVGGVAYPDAAANTCASSASSISYPAKNLGGLIVSRSVSASGSRLRHLDTITNTGAQKVVNVDFGIEVLPSQVSVASETGSGFEVTKDDHWAVLENSGGSFPFLQWGQKGDGAHDPAILSEHPDTPTIWQHHAGDMPDATLRYQGLVVPANATVRLLHVSGTTTAQATSVAAAKDRATPFAGYTKATASTIANWGNDSDGDGVSKFQDDCPSVKGNTGSGCLLDVQPPQPGDDPTPPVDPNGGGNGGGTGGETGGGTTGGGTVGETGGGSTADRTAPTITVTKLAKAAKRSTLRKGIAPKVRCSEACRVTVKVLVAKKGRKKASTVLSTKPTKLSAAVRSVKLKVSSSKLTKLRKKALTLKITATDAAGNARTVTKTVKLK